MSKKFEFIEHTADLGFRAHADTMEELFACAAEAFFETILSTESLDERIERSIQVEAETPDELMVAWLDEFLYLYDTEKLAFKRFRVEPIRKNRLKANAWGEVMDPARHEIKTGIKAVTYHKLYVKEAEGRWETQVILDI
jgi:SHS2 domain-containing protein